MSNSKRRDSGFSTDIDRQNRLMETRCYQYKIEFRKDIRHKVSVPLAMSTKITKIGQRKTQPNGQLEAARFQNSERHRLTKQKTASWTLNGARSLGAPNHLFVTVFTTRPVISGRRRPGVWKENVCPRVCWKQPTKILDPPPVAEKRPFMRFGRRAYDAAGNTSHLRPRIRLTSSRPWSTSFRPCLTRARLAVGWISVEIEGLSSCEMFLISVRTIFYVQAKVPPPAAA